MRYQLRHSDTLRGVGADDFPTAGTLVAVVILVALGGYTLSRRGEL